MDISVFYMSHVYYTRGATHIADYLRREIKRRYVKSTSLLLLDSQTLIDCMFAFTAGIENIFEILPKKYTQIDL